jgi:hypothetical protein
MQHADGLAVRSFQLVAPQPLMPPDGLKQALGGEAVFVAQRIRSPALAAPDGAKIFSGRIQSEKSLPRPGDEVKAIDKLKVPSPKFKAQKSETVRFKSVFGKRFPAISIFRRVSPDMLLGVIGNQSSQSLKRFS